MTSEMRITLLLGMAAWLIFYAAALLQRLRLEWHAEARALSETAAPSPADGRVRP
jgi:hypothetical protein